jgi:hypothetical protein
MLARRMARDTSLGMHTAWPVERQDMRRRLLSGINDHLMQDRTEEAFFEGLRRGRRMPDSAQILAQAESPLAWLVIERALVAR